MTNNLDNQPGKQSHFISINFFRVKKWMQNKIYLILYQHLPEKISWCTSDPLPDVMYVTSEKYVSKLTNISGSQQLIVLDSYDTITQHIIIS